MTQQAERRVHAVFGYGIYTDLRISDMWLTVMSFFPASEVHGVQRISPEELQEGIMAENTFSHTCKGLNRGLGDVQETS